MAHGHGLRHWSVARTGPRARDGFRSLSLDATYIRPTHTQTSLLLVSVGIRGWDWAREIFPEVLHFPRTPSKF